MRKLLQSKVAVGVLVVIAAVAVTANFVSLPKLLGVSAAARNSVEPAALPLETPIIKMPPASRLATEQQMWRELFPINTGIRDPFAPPADAVSRTPPTNSIAGDPFGIPAFVLQAISHEPGRAYAVVNQQVLIEGEQLFGYTVERILPSSVELRGPSGAISLSFPRTTARQKPPIGKPAAADLPAAGQRSSTPGSPR
jgi:hypothetical protein